jgi:hypothetical protein
MSLAHLVPDGLVPKQEHADVLLELAYLITAVDGRLDDGEIDAYREIVARLRGKKSVTDADLDVLFDRFGGNVEHEEIHDRVKKIAKTLPDDLRGLAFKLAVGLSVVDLDANEDETDLQVVLAESLGLDEAKVDELTAEVYGALEAGGDEP